MMYKNTKSINLGIVCILLGIALGLFLLRVTTMPFPMAYITIGALFFPILLLLFNAERILLSIIILDIPFKIDTMYFYAHEFKKLGVQAGLYLSLTTYSLILLYGLWFGKKVLNKQAGPTIDIRPHLSVGAYVLVAFISIYFAQRKDFALYQSLLLLQMLFLFVYIAAKVRTRQDLMFIIVVLIGGMLAESLIMIALKLTGKNFEFMGFNARIHGNRVGGTIGHPNSAGMYLAFLLPLAVSLLLTKIKTEFRILCLAAVATGAIALLFTLSRGSWISTGIALSALYFFALKRRLVSPQLLVFTAIGAGIFLLVFQEEILLRLLGDDRGSAQSRWPLMKIAIQIIADYPIWGAGINNYVLAMQPYATKLERGFVWVYTVHNFYLLTLAETGFVGLLALLWYLFNCIQRGFVCWSYNDNFLSPIGLAISATFIGETLHMLVDIYNNPVALKLMFFFGGLLVAIKRIGETNGIATKPALQHKSP